MNESKAYREMCEPLPTSEAAQSALRKFRDGVTALRRDCHLPDVYVVASVRYISDDGDESHAVATHGIGDQFQHEALLAYGLGVVQSERQSFINGLMVPKGVITKRMER